MPYIKQSQRDKLHSAISNLLYELDKVSDEEIEGVLNYTITEIMNRRMCNEDGTWGYKLINRVVGTLENVKLEFYRRLAASYEDKAINKNGDLSCYTLHDNKGVSVSTGLDGSKYWLLNGNRHREDGPAIEYSDGGEEWWINNQLHREDGPAIMHSNGYKAWYRHGKKLKEFKSQPKRLDYDGWTEYRLNGKLHREDGPAIEYSNGGEEWWINDQLHREDGPAIVDGVTGGKEWWLNGKLC